MGESIVIPIRSGITNTLVWLFIEIIALWSIEIALLRIHNDTLTKAIESGLKIQIKESRIPLVGTGLMAHGTQSKLFILCRTTLLVSFLLMNIGIDGTKKRLYATKTLHSQLELRSVADGNKMDTSYERPYAQMNNYNLMQCTKLSDDERRFTVFKPVFNLTKAPNPESVTTLVVQREGSTCLDGRQTKRNEILIRGELPGKGIDGEPMVDGTRFRIKARNVTLGIKLLHPGSIVRIEDLTTKEKAPFNGNAKFIDGYCTPRERSKIQDSKKWGQAVNCFFVFKQHGMTVFSVKQSYIHNIWLPSDRVPIMTMGTRARAIRVNLNASLSKNNRRSLAHRLLFAEPSYQVAPMIATILKYHYSATMDRKPFDIAVRVGDQLATEVSIFSVCIASVVILTAFLLIAYVVAMKSCSRRNGSPQIELCVNSINGLSKILAFEHINEERSAAPNTLAEIGIYEAGPGRLRVGPANKKVCIPADSRHIEGRCA